MREAATHAWAPGQVLKLFKAGVSRRLARHEARMTRAAAGVPAPEVLGEVTLRACPLVHETRVVPGGERLVLSDPDPEQILTGSTDGREGVPPLLSGMPPRSPRTPNRRTMQRCACPGSCVRLPTGDTAAGAGIESERDK
jgi:hypothetical protein